MIYLCMNIWYLVISLSVFGFDWKQFDTTKCESIELFKRNIWFEMCILVDVGLDALCLLCASVYGYEKYFDLDYGSYSMFVHFCSKLRSHASSSKYTAFKVWNPLRQTTSCVTSILIQPPSLVLFPYSTSRVCNEETTFTITNIKNLKFSALTIDLLKTLHYVTVCVCVFEH